MLHHVHLASSSLDVLGSRCPPWASPSSFTHRTPPSVLYQLLVSLTPGVLHALSQASHLCLIPPRGGPRCLPGAPSCASHLCPSRLIFSWRPQHRVASWGISILVHVQAISCHLLVAPPSSFTCTASPSISNHLLGSLMPGTLPEHLHAPSHASHFPLFCHLLVSLSPGGLPGHLQPSSHASHIPPSCTMVALVGGGLLRHLRAPSFPSCLPPSSLIVSQCPQHWVPSCSIFISPHVRATFLHLHHLLVSSSTRRLPGASPFSSTSSRLHPPRLLVSSTPGAFLEHLHPPPHQAISIHLVSWCSHHWVSSWGISTLLRIPSQMPQLACALPLHQQMHQVA